MDGRQKSDAQSESANDRRKDDVIDLTQVIQEENDDEIIDLTNVLGQPGVAPDALKKGTDQTADTDETLTDLEELNSDADEGKTGDISTGKADINEEEVLDLAEMEKTLEVDISESSFEEDEDLVDLIDSEGPDATVDSDMDDLGDVDDEDGLDLMETGDPGEMLDSDMDNLEDDDKEDIIDLTETAKPGETLDSDMDDLEDDDEDIIDLIETANPGEMLDSNMDDLKDDEDEDEDIIDLMKTANPGEMLDSDLDETDEIADLEPGSQVAASDPLETAEIIDLNIAESSLPSVDEDQELSFSDENTDDEDIIDLAVMEEALDADLLAIEADDDTEEEEEEEILDLLDVEDGSPQAAQADDTTDALPPEAPLFTDTLDPTEEIDIRTMQDSENGEDVLAPDEYADDDEIIDLAEMETALDADASDDILEDDQEEDENVIDLLGVDVPETPAAKATPDETIDEDLTLDTPVGPPASTSVQLSEAQIEAALERTIRNIYGEKIEQLMIQTIEKTVLQEIAKIKQALMENDDDASN